MEASRLMDNTEPTLSLKKSKTSSTESTLRKFSSASVHWKWQLLSWFASCCCFIAIVVVLRTLEGRTLPELRFGLTPNAIIGLLATFMEFLLIGPVDSAIGQIKWLRALKQQPLDDFRAIDEASRGPRGSAVLLARRRGGPAASLGALIMLVALGIGTFVQQTLKYETSFAAAPNAFAPIARSLEQVDPSWAHVAFDSARDVSGFGIPREILGVPYTAIFSPPNQSFNVTAQCATGNCTWDPYPTLGIRSTCQDITTLINKTTMPLSQPADADDTVQWPQDTHQFTLPNGFGLSGRYWSREYGIWPNGSMASEAQLYEPMLNITTDNLFRMYLTPAQEVQLSNMSYDYYESLFFKSVAFPNITSRTKILNFFAVGASSGESATQVYSSQSPGVSNNSYTPGVESPIAFECMLEWCIRTLRGEFRDGTFRETEVSTWTWDSHTNYSETPIEKVQDPVSKQWFSIDPALISTVSQWLPYFGVGNVTSRISSDNNNLLPGTQGVPNPITGSTVFVEAIYRAMNDSNTGFPGIMNNLAHSLSSAFQTFPNQDMAIGSAISVSSRAVVRWEWLVLPIMELLGSLVILITVVVQTRKLRLNSWSNNVLPFFFHGIENLPFDSNMYGSQGAMQKRANEILVEFRPSGDGGRLVILNQ